MTITLDPNNVLTGLMVMAIVTSILLLAVAIIVYPTIKDRHAHSSKKSAR
jgi:hypothetical protein